MRKWCDRPFEIKNLFCPSFCGLLLLRSLQGFEEIDDKGMPFSLSLLVLPLCLHKETRNIILQSSRTYFLKMIFENPQILINFPKRCEDLLGYTFEGLGLMMTLHGFTVTDNGRLIYLKGGVRNAIVGTEESKDCQKAAILIGKGFAKVNDRVTIYTSLGVKP